MNSMAKPKVKEPFQKVQCKLCGAARMYRRLYHPDVQRFINGCSTCRKELRNQQSREKGLVHNCPNCDEEMLYSGKYHFERARQKLKLCPKCAYSKWISDAQSTRIYNKLACRMMDTLNSTGKYFFQHAENGGEYMLTCGQMYFLDGYDAINQIVFEYDEPCHELKRKQDALRQEHIFEHFDSLGKKIRFIRYKEVTKQFVEVFPHQDAIESTGQHTISVIR